MIFERAVAHTLKYEGGYANHSADSGGETYRGIARNFWGSWPGWVIVDEVKKHMPHHGQHNRQELNRRLAADQQLQSLVIEFYRYHFWSAVKADKMPDNVAAKVFDMSVNVGVMRAGKMLQAALLSINQRVIIDGIIGKKTLAAANRSDPQKLIKAICCIQERFYRGIVNRKPSQKVFLNGWLRRAAYRGEL